MKMDSTKATSPAVSRAVVIQRNNLINVCRFAVKSLIYKSCYEVVDETSEEVVNVCAIIEHILSFQLRPCMTWYGLTEQADFWDFIQATCRHIPNSCLPSVHAMEQMRSRCAKGRAWLRLALIEKRLSDYLAFAFEQPHMCSRYYYEGSVVCSEQVSMLPGMLIELGSIDFSFDLKGSDLDTPGLPVIDYMPFMKAQHGDSPTQPAVSCPQLEVPDSECLGMQRSHEEWCRKHEEKYRLACQQKGYLEVLLQKRVSELAECQRQRSLYASRIEHNELNWAKERKQLEAVILELQAQMSLQSEEHARRLHHLQMSLHRDMPVITMSHLMSLEVNEEEGVERRDQNESTASEIAAVAKEPTQSLRGLAGSLTEASESAPGVPAS